MLTDTEVIQHCDKYHTDEQFDDEFQLLSQYKTSNNVEILWRLARTLRRTACEEEKKEKKIEIIQEAYNHIQRALAIDDKHFAVHRTLALVVDSKSELEGIKARMHGSSVFHSHLKVALELNNKDPETLQMLAIFYYHVSDMPWFLKQMATQVANVVPQSTFEEALEYFIKSEDIHPNTGKNHLWIGKTHLKMKNLEEAKHWLESAIKVSAEDKICGQTITEEAESLIANLNKKEEKHKKEKPTTQEN